MDRNTRRARGYYNTGVEQGEETWRRCDEGSERTACQQSQSFTARIVCCCDAPQTSKEGLRTLIRPGQAAIPIDANDQGPTTGPPALLAKGGFEPGPSPKRWVRTQRSLEGRATNTPPPKGCERALEWKLRILAGYHVLLSSERGWEVVVILTDTRGYSEAGRVGRRDGGDGQDCVAKKRESSAVARSVCYCSNAGMYATAARPLCPSRNNACMRMYATHQTKEYWQVQNRT